MPSIFAASLLNPESQIKMTGHFYLIGIYSAKLFLDK